MNPFKTKRLILVRHGETAWNAEGRIQGMLDVPLNELGMQQARLVAAELARIVDVAEHVASDLVRTQETASPIAEATGFEPRFDARIRERNFGIWQGMTYEQWRIKDAEGMARYNAGDPDYGPEGGETAQQFLERCVNAITDLVMGAREKTLLLVTHGGVVSSMVRHSNGLSPQSARTWSVPNASISEWRVVWADGAPIFYCDRVGDVAHLAHALDEVDIAPSHRADTGLSPSAPGLGREPVDTCSRSEHASAAASLTPTPSPGEREPNIPTHAVAHCE